MKLLILIPCIIFTVLILYSCDDTINANDIDNREIPDSNVSFSKDIAPIFNLKCTSCHGSGRLDGGVDLTTWAGVVDPSLLIPGAADASLLVWTIEWRSGYPPMPPQNSSFRPLTAKQIKGVKTWIDEGAKNN